MSTAAFCRRGGGKRPRRSRASSHRRSLQPCATSGAGAALSAGDGGPDRGRTAGDRLSPLSRLGRPSIPDEPLASRKPALETTSGIEAAIAAVEARLAARPDDGKGWAVIAPVYMRLGRYDDAAHAFAEALRILGEDPLRRAAYGEALVAAAGGVVTADARKAFDRALAEQPGQPQARFYLALAAEQDGKKANAIRD